MKFLGLVKDPKDVTTKEYVDNKCQELDNKKLDSDNVVEYTADEVLSVWNSVFKNSNK